MRTLILPENVYADICTIVGETRNDHETGVALFGICIPHIVSRASYAADSWPTLVHYHFVVLGVAGPGPRATHEPAHYSADEDYTSSVYRVLRSTLPSIEWLGELHVHPRGMTWLSGGDRRTVKELLARTATDTISPYEIIAGVMQRRRQGVEIYPSYFSRRLPEGCTMGIERVSADADLARKARESARERYRARLPAAGHPEERRDDEAPPCQGWLAHVVSIVRRNHP